MSDQSCLAWFQAKALAVVESLRASLELEHVVSVSLAALGRAQAVGARGAEPSPLGELCGIGSENGNAAVLLAKPGVDPKLVARAIQAMGLSARVEGGKIHASLTSAVCTASAKRCASRRMPAILALREIRRKAKKAFPHEDWALGSPTEKAICAELAKMESAVESMVERNSRPFR